MATKAYRTLSDIGNIVANAIPEGVSLEYKASDILVDRRSDKLCKTVTAFANSVGGQFVIGVVTKEGVPAGLDGGVPLPSRRDWIHQIISNQTSPPVEAFEVFEIQKPGGSYYVVDVPPSASAPHQYDGRYYKRRGPHSEPMEHYEIEDVRNRPKTALPPLRMEISLQQEVMLLLTIRNDHATAVLANLTFKLTHTFKLDSGGGIETLAKRGLRGLRPGTELAYYLGSTHQILRESPEAVLTVSTEYDYLGKRTSETFSFFVGDLMNTAIIRSDQAEAMRKLTDKVGDLVRELERSRNQYAELLQMVDDTGLRLSHHTVGAMRGEAHKYEPGDFDSRGYRRVLGISEEDARKIARIFDGRFGAGDNTKAEYDKLPESVRKKFEEMFRVPFP